MCVCNPVLVLTVLRLQLGAGFSRHEAGHEAVVVLGTDAALGDDRGGDGHGGGDVGPRDDRATGGGRRGGGRGRRGGGLPCGGQVLFLWVHIDGVQADLSCAAGLPLVLHRCRKRRPRNIMVYICSLDFNFTQFHMSSSTRDYVSSLTVFIHACLQALLQTTGLTLVAVSFVHWTHACTSLAPVSTVNLLGGVSNKKNLVFLLI